jgi:hypothetical protein
VTAQFSGHAQSDFVVAAEMPGSEIYAPFTVIAVARHAHRYWCSMPVQRRRWRRCTNKHGNLMAARRDLQRFPKRRSAKPLGERRSLG